MTPTYENDTEEVHADYEVSYEEGVCLDVGWTTEEKRELYNVEWKEPLHEGGYFDSIQKLFRS